MSIITDFSQSAQNALDEANELLSKKNKHFKELNSLADSFKDQSTLSSQQIKQLKDYHYYKGRGWGSDQVTGEIDPLIRIKGTKFPDRISGPFIRFLTIIQNCYKAGDTEILDDYIEALRKYGVDISINIKPDAKPNNYDDTITAMSAQQKQICELADELNDVYKIDFDQQNICSKKTFNTALNAYHKIKNGKNIEKSLNKLYIDSTNDARFATVLSDDNKNNI